MNAEFATVTTPCGPFSVIAKDTAVLASGWTADLQRLLPMIHSSLRPTALHTRPELGDVTKAVLAYHDGDLCAIDTIPVRQHGSDFLREAWHTLRSVAPGQIVTYTEFAALSRRPRAVRAAASACARNAAALFVPCHRVARTDGTLGGFGWGLDIKRWLLSHESPR